MLLHTDIPTQAQLRRLLASRIPASVSIYLPTDPVSANVGERIELGNLAAEALELLSDAGVAKRELVTIEQEMGDLIEDETFWRYHARSLAIFATPEDLTTFRLPNRLLSTVVVSDRFHLKPLLRAVTFPQVALVLALAQGSVRVIEARPTSSRRRWPCPTCRRMPPAPLVAPRSRTEPRSGGSRAQKDASFVCGSTRAKLMERSGRCWAEQVCR
jgi:hypothetical protein